MNDKIKYKSLVVDGKNVDKLAGFIIKEIDWKPSEEKEDVCECAIEIIQELQKRIRFLENNNEALRESNSVHFDNRMILQKEVAELKKKLSKKK